VSKAQNVAVSPLQSLYFILSPSFQITTVHQKSLKLLSIDDRAMHSQKFLQFGAVNSKEYSSQIVITGGQRKICLSALIQPLSAEFRTLIVSDGP